jgi:tungstate transport system substrate-binding protein
MKELALWKEAGITVPDKEPWYIQVGQGMIQTINIAAERNGYTLTDRAHLHQVRGETTRAILPW